MPQGMTVGRVNELTTVTRVKPLHVEITRRALESSLPLARSALQDIQTIHYACWVVLPMNGAHYLLFVSNYTGTFEKYIDDFATTLTLGLGLDAIWWNCQGWPGVGNVERLKQFIRATTTRAGLFYSAYPQATVRDVIKALQATGAVETLFEVK